MANREVTVRLSADISGYINSMQQAADATDRAATAADRLDQSAARASTSAQASSQGFQQASQAADTASASMEGMGTATQSASEGASASSEALFRLSGGLSGTASDADRVSGAFTQATTTTGSFATGLDGLGTSFASGLSFSDGLSGSILGLAERATQARGHFAEFGAEMSRINSESRSFAGGLAVAGGGLTAIMTSVINTGIAYNTLQQVAGRAMETMTGSAEAAANQMDRLHEFADTSPFARDVWIEAQQQLMAFGMEAENVVPTMEGIQNAVAAIGGGDQEVMRLVEILGQVQGQGRITGRELQRMGQMGINAADIIGEAMGVSGNEIREQITNGALDADTAISALTDGMNTRFAGAAEGLRDTMTGALDRIRARIRDLGGIIAAPLVDPNGGGFLVEAINQAADFGTALLEINPLILQIAGLGATAAGGILALGGAWGLASTQITAFAGGMKQAIVATRNLTTGLFTTLGGLRTLATTAGIAAAAFVAWKVLDELSHDVDEFASSVSEMRQELVRLADGGDPFANVQWTRAEEGRESIDNLGEAMERASTGGVQGFNDSMNRFFSSILPVTSAVDDLDENLANLDQAMADAFQSGDFEYAAAGFANIAEEAERLNWSAEEVANQYPAMTDAIRDAASAAGITATDQDLLAVATNAAALEALHAGENWELITGLLRQGKDATYEASDAMGQAAGSADTFAGALAAQAEAASDAAEGLSGLLTEMDTYGGLARDAEQVSLDWLASLREIDEAIGAEAESIAELETAYANGQITRDEYRQGIEDATFTLDRNTDAGQENHEMLIQLADDMLEAAAAEAQRSESLEATQEVMDEGIQRFRDMGEAAGLTESEIDDLIRTYTGMDGPEPIEIQAENRAQEVFDEVEEGINALDDDFTFWLDAQDERVQDVLAALMDGDHEAVVDIAGDDAVAQAAIEAFESGEYRAIADIIAHDDGANEVMYNFQTGQYEAQVDILGNPSDVNEIIAAVMNDDHEAVIDVLGDDVDASAVIEAVESGDYQTLVDITGDDDMARQIIDGFVDTPWMTDVLANANVGPAEAVLDETTRDRIANIMAEADSWNAEGVLTETARQRIAGILAESETGIAESDLNGAARQRIADILAEPNTFNAEGQLTDTARERISDILAQPFTWGAESDLNNTARGRDSNVTAVPLTSAAERALNYLARNRTSTLTVHQATVMAGTTSNSRRPAGFAGGGRAGMGLGGFATGGRASAGLPRLATGGRLPSTGLGTDKILGISSITGEPTAYVDDLEWIINGKSSEKYNPLLRAINDDNPRAIQSAVDTIPRYEVGGRNGTNMHVREFPSRRTVIDYDQLATAMGSGAAMSAEASLVDAQIQIGADGLGRFVDGRIRVSMKDPSVIRAASQGLADESRRDSRRG